ncbi:DUF551 domain-containing protein [Klebsiella quasipneumoniae]|uniref:DUF551 domain-containing protein n=1 Tax=Klebsiella quasipneumoniae TaxID=1463165 RepID=UPI0039830B0E
MSEFSRETLLNIIETDHVQCGEASALARMALAAMDSSESVELPLDYLQGHKDGLEWAAQLAEANHPETGDWLYDDPIELAKAIRKGPDMPPSQPVADSEPVIVVGDDGGDALSYRRLIQSFEPGTKLYRHAQPAPVVPDEVTAEDCPAFVEYEVAEVDEAWARGFNACRAATLQASNCRENSNSSTNNFREMLETSTNSPVIPDTWIPVSERIPDENADQQVLACFKGGDISALYYSDGRWDDAYGIVPIRQDVTHWMPLPAAPQEDINALIPLVSRNEQEVK